MKKQLFVLFVLFYSGIVDAMQLKKKADSCPFSIQDKTQIMEEKLNKRQRSMSVRDNQGNTVSILMILPLVNSQTRKPQSQSEGTLIAEKEISWYGELDSDDDSDSSDEEVFNVFR